MAVTAFNFGGGSPLKLTETLECEAHYTTGGGSVITTRKHKYVLIVCCGYNYDRGNSGWSPYLDSISVGTEILKNKIPQNGTITNTTKVSLYSDVPAGTKIVSGGSPSYASNGGLFVLCFD